MPCMILKMKTMETTLERVDLKYINTLKELIEEVLKDTQKLDIVVSSSIEHDNGFYKIVLKERNNADCGYRLHYWKPNTYDSNIHSHRWHMQSIILDGGYHSCEYYPSPLGVPYHKYNFVPDSKNNYSLHPVGTDNLETFNDREYLKGETYFLERGKLHKVKRVNDSGALSAIVSWGDAISEALVYSNIELGEYTSAQRPLSKNEVIKYLHKAQLILNNFNCD
jgi:hypothetical protein